MREFFEAEIEGKPATCWISMGDLHAEFLDGTYKIYHNINVHDVRFDVPENVLKEYVFIPVIDEAKNESS